MINENITEILSYLEKIPLIFTLTIPIILIYCATKLENASVEVLILFGVIGISDLIFAGWVVKQLIANGISR
ncbi:MAG: hypothetical protein ISR72_00440 [Methylobacter sp.]|nr:hypothetical protein [Methylobacter sp.]